MVNLVHSRIGNLFGNPVQLSGQKKSLPIQLPVINGCLAILLSVLISVSSSINAQNTCLAPVVIPAIPYSSGALTTCGSVNDYPAGSYFTTDYGGGEDYVFSLNIMSAPVTYQFSLGGGATWKIASVHSACPPTMGNAIGGLTTSSGTSNSGNITFPATGVYYIFIDTWPTPTCGAFTLDITLPPPPPANDNCSSATSLTVNPNLTCTSTTNGTTVSATASTETAPSCAPTGVNDDVWYTFTATSSVHIITLSNVAGTTTDMAMALYSGACGSLTHIQCSDPNTMTASGLSIGTAYTLRVWTAPSTSGTASFTVCITTPPPPPANDDCVNAIELSVNPDLLCGVSIAGTTASATQSTGTTPSCNTTGINDDVWYKFTATATSLTLTLHGTTVATAAQVYSGSCGSLVTVACGASSTSSPTLNGLNLNLTGLIISNLYYVRVYSTSSVASTTSNFNICLGTPIAPPNNEPAGAFSLTVGSPRLISTALATQTLTACTGTADDDVWYLFTPPADGAYSFAFTNLSGVSDIGYEIFLGLPANGISLACHDSPESGTSFDGFLAANTYYLRVYAWESLTAHDIIAGQVTVTAYNLTPPSNNGCASPLSITPSTNGACTFAALNSTNATYSLLKPSCITSVFPPAHDDDIWVNFTASVSGPHVFKTQTSGTYGIEAYTGTCGTLTPVASSCSTSFTGTTGFTIALTASTTYLVRIWKTSTGGGAFDLCVEMPLACSTPTATAATFVTSTTAQANWTCLGCSGTYIIEYGLASNFTTPGIDNNPGTNGTIVTSGAGTTNVVLMGLLATTQYRYFVRQNCTGSGNGYSPNSSAITFTTLAPPPANDECSSPTSLTVNADLSCGSSVAGTTLNATQSTGTTPTCSSGGINDDVWYSFTAVGSIHTIQISGATNATTVQVYSGTCGTLGTLFCGSTSSGILNLTASGLTPATLYYLRVYSTSTLSSTSTNFTICVGTPPPPPVNDICSGALVIPTNQGWPYLTPTVNNTDATNTGDPTNICQGNSNKGVWYSFVPTITGSWNLSVCQSDAPLSAISDNVIAIFSSSNGCAGPLTEVGCADDECGTQAMVDVSLTSGSQYYILVYGWSTNVGVIQMKVTPPAAPLTNDDATGAISLTVGAACTGNIYSNVGASLATGEPYPDCSGDGATPVWFSFVAPPGGVVRISTDIAPLGTFEDSKIALFSATDPSMYNTFTIIACDEDGGITDDGWMSVVYASGLTSGQTYYIAVDKYDEDVTNGTFCVQVDALSASMLSNTNTCVDAAQTPISSGNFEYDGWFAMQDEDGKLIALLKDVDGVDVSDFDAAQNVHPGAVREDNAGHKYLDRNWYISDNGFGYSNVLVQLFFTDGEFADLQAADPSVTSLSQLKVTKTLAEQPDDCSDLSFTDPVLLPQTGSGSTGGVSWIQFTTPSFSNFYIHGGLVALPIRLLSFEGMAMKDYNKVMWYTENEVNFDQFEVQRASSTTGQFTSIGTVKSGHRSGDYVYEDKQPLSSGFYRLKMMDLDGQFSYSKVINIKRAGTTFAIRNVFPNPSTDFVNVELISPEKMDMDISLLDITGKEIRTITSSLTEGEQTITFSLEGIQPGTYFLNALGRVSKVIKL